MSEETERERLDPVEPGDFVVTGDIQEYTRGDRPHRRSLIMRISSKVGCKPAKTALTKWALNSLVARFTGEFPCRPGGINQADAPTSPELRERIGSILGFEYQAGKWDRAFRVDELEKITAALVQTTDRRPSTDTERLGGDN